MSAWMSGIGLGLQAAQMEQHRNQQAQEMAFRQQQAGINNAQEDRRFDAAQSADIRDFDAMQQWREFQRQQAAQQFAERKAALDRDIMGQQATAQVFKAISAPDQTEMMPGVAMGEGSSNYNASAQLLPHPTETLDFNTISGAAPQALNALVGFRQNRAEMKRRRQFATYQAESARADGSIRHVDPRTAKEWADLGLYSDGTIRPDEMPLPIAKQLESQRNAMAEMMATQPGQDGSLSVNPDVFERLRQFPHETLKMMYEQKSRMDAAMEVARLRGQNALDVAKVRADARGSGSQQLTAARFKVGQAEKEYRSLTGQMGKMGNLAEPSKAVTKSAEDFSGGTGHWFKTDGTQERHVRMVAAWEKYQQALAEYDQAATEAYNPQQRGLLDGPDGAAQQESQQDGQIDVDSIFQQVETDMPGATDEQIANELQRRIQQLQGG